jgi:site-specific DNA-methyltransferase (adenine-specific)
MLDRVATFIANVAQTGDALTLLQSLPNASAALGFIDPQFRELLSRQAYGNEGISRQTARARLPAMTPEYITAVTVEFGRVLKPSAYLLRWTDKYVLCEGRHLGISTELFKIVDLIATDNERIGMGYRTRYRGDFLLVMQRPPTKARATWSDHSIPDRWIERVDRTVHPHVKPIGLIERLIAAVTVIGDTVIDPAAGGFGVMYAAHKLERNFIGCDAAYCGASGHA